MAALGASAVMGGMAYAVTCNPVTQSLVDGRCVDQRIIDCGRNPGMCGGTNPNIRGPVVTGIPLDAAYYAQQAQNALTARYWDEYIRAQNARVARIMAGAMRSRPSVVRPRPEVPVGAQPTQSTGEGGSSQTNSVVNVINCGVGGTAQLCGRLRGLGCGWSERLRRCIRDNNE